MSQQRTINNNPDDNHQHLHQQHQSTTPLLLLSTTEIKSQLSLLNQQLLSSLLSNITIQSNTNGVDTSQSQQHNQYLQRQQPSSSSPPINQIELIKITSQLEQNCDEIMKKEIDIEMKCKVLDIERREFELTKKEFYSQQHQPQQDLQQPSQKNQQQSQDQQSLTLSSTSTSSTSTSSLLELPSTETSINIQQHQQSQPSSFSLSTPTDEQTTTSTIQSMVGLLQHVMDDYQAMKYLVDQSTTTHQSLQQQYLTFNQSMNNFNNVTNDIETNLSNMNDKLELGLSKVNEFELQLQQLQQSLTEQSIEGINNNNQKQIQPQVQVINSAQQQRVSLPAMLEQNYQLFKSRSKKSSPFVAFAFENLPGIYMSCGFWIECSLHYVFYDCVIDRSLKTHLQQHKSTIENSKLFISSKSVFNGEWIQIQGDGKVIDIKDIKVSSLLKDGDDIYDYNDYSCRKSCGYCNFSSSVDKTTKRFLIKFKWE